MPKTNVIIMKLKCFVAVRNNILRLTTQWKMVYVNGDSLTMIPYSILNINQIFRLGAMRTAFQNESFGIRLHRIQVNMMHSVKLSPPLAFTVSCAIYCNIIIKFKLCLNTIRLYFICRLG